MIRPALLAVALALALAGGAAAEELRVVAISDGDTFTAVDAANRQLKIRLHGIDALEKNQPFGQAARRALADKIQGRSVEVAAVDRDRYGRTIARVSVDGREVNAAQIREGMASRYVDYDRRGENEQAEAEARAGRRGFWADERPIPPWEWRKTSKERRAARMPP